jgi:hypothetical protein
MIDQAPDTWHDKHVPIRLTVPLALAQYRERQAFWRGLVIGGLTVGAIFIASAAII